MTVRECGLLHYPLMRCCAAKNTCAACVLGLYMGTASDRMMSAHGLSQACRVVASHLLFFAAGFEICCRAVFI